MVSCPRGRRRWAIGDDEIASLREAIWGDASLPATRVRKRSPAGGLSFLLPEKPSPEEIQEALSGFAEVHPALEVVEGETNHWLHVLHRVKAGRDVFLVCNQNSDGKAERFRFRIRADGVPECWDAMRNAIEAVPFERTARTSSSRCRSSLSRACSWCSSPRSAPCPGGTSPRPSLRRLPIPVVREAAVASSVPPPPPLVPDYIRRLEGCSWTWYPESSPGRVRSPGHALFPQARDHSRRSDGQAGDVPDQRRQ